MNARILRRATAGIAALGLVFPPSLLSAAEPQTPTPGASPRQMAKINDVALAVSGTLQGQVVDGAGTALPGVTVTVRQQENLVAQVVSDAQGRFQVAGMPGGIFTLTTPGSDGNFRLWAPGTAPPGARPAALVVHNPQVVRGQASMSKLMSRPIVIGMIIATAIAVPVAIHAIQTHRQSGS